MVKYAHIKDKVVYDILTTSVKKDGATEEPKSLEFTKDNQTYLPYMEIKFTSTVEGVEEFTKDFPFVDRIDDGDTYKDDKFTPLGFDSYYKMVLDEFEEKYVSNLLKGITIDIPFYYKNETGPIPLTKGQYGAPEGGDYTYTVTLMNDGEWKKFSIVDKMTKLAEDKAKEILDKDTENTYTVTITAE
jgi:hypothetical protein